MSPRVRAQPTVLLRMRTPWRRIALFLIWVHALVAAPLQAQGVRVELQAPESVRALLSENMPVLRFSAQRLDEADRLRILRDARRQAAELLATEGYFAPEVQVHDGAAGVVVSVEPGRRAQVSAVHIEFKGGIVAPDAAGEARMQSLREDWALKLGMPFRQQDWDLAKQRALLALLAQDYAAASIAESQAEVDPEQGTVALRVVYDSGPAFTLGELQVSGLEDYEQSLVGRYSDLQRGERYSLERLLALQSRLQNTPYFSSVVVDIDSDPAQAREVPVRVQVRESKPKRVGLGVGFSSNTRYRAEVNFRHANLFDRAWNLTSALRLEQLRQTAYADVLLPPTAKDYRDGFGVLGEASDIQGLATARAAVGVQRTRLRGNIETRVALNLQRERTEVSGGEAATKRALALSWSWTYRDVDNPLDPRRGYVFNVQTGGAAKAALSDQNFLRGYLRHQHFLPVGSRDVLALRGEAGITAAPSRDGIPEEFLFRAGGSQSVRGYAYQSLGVREGDAIVGGRYIVTASAEYTHWFAGNWGAAAFYDAGNAADVPSDLGLVSGYGLGARWRSPAGPLAFDLAYGEKERRLRVHFSVAIAF